MAIDFIPTGRFIINPTERNFQSMVRSAPELALSVSGTMNPAAGIYSIASTVWAGISMSQVGLKEYFLDEEDNELWDLYYYELFIDGKTTDRVDKISSKIYNFFNPQLMNQANPSGSVSSTQQNPSIVRNSGRGRGGFSSPQESSNWWGGLGDYASNNPDQTASDILSNWQSAWESGD